MKSILCFALPLIFSLTISAQFNSGSTGADGGLDLSTMTCPNNICWIQLPESGVLNYTTVNVPISKSLRFKKNSRNTPVVILAQGNVTIAGDIDISANTGDFLTHGQYPDNGIAPGPGGFGGGYGNPPLSGFGPGGGQAPSNAISCNSGYPAQTYGKWIGALSLVPLIGGSGGASVIEYQGGGGGGAIAIASSTLITVSGSIYASGRPGNSRVGCGPSGSGGAIRLVSNSITVSGQINALGNDGGGGGNSGNGVIRFEAQQGQIDFSGTAKPTAIFATINPVIIPSNPPTLTITSIGGYAVPSSSAGRPDRVDLVLPTQLADPLNVIIQGTNVPSGTQVQLQLSAPSGTATGCTLTGGPGPVYCTATVTGLNRNAVSTLLAVAIFNPPPAAQAFNSKGANQVAKVRLESALGGTLRYIFLNSSGKEIEAKKLSPQFLQQFGM